MVSPGDTEQLSANYDSRQARFSIRYAAWCLVWAISLTISDYGVEQGLVYESLKWPVTLFPAVLALWVFYQYFIWYSSVDELTRKIQLESLALGFAAGLFILILFMCLENVGISDPGLNELFAIFAVSHVAAQLLRSVSYFR